MFSCQLYKMFRKSNKCPNDKFGDIFFWVTRVKFIQQFQWQWPIPEFDHKMIFCGSNKNLCRLSNKHKIRYVGGGVDRYTWISIINCSTSGNWCFYLSKEKMENVFLKTTSPTALIWLMLHLVLPCTDWMNWQSVSHNFYRSKNWRSQMKLWLWCVKKDCWWSRYDMIWR